VCGDKAVLQHCTFRIAARPRMTAEFSRIRYTEMWGKQLPPPNHIRDWSCSPVFAIQSLQRVCGADAARRFNVDERILKGRSMGRTDVIVVASQLSETILPDHNIHQLHNTFADWIAEYYLISKGNDRREAPTIARPRNTKANGNPEVSLTRSDEGGLLQLVTAPGSRDIPW